MLAARIWIDDIVVDPGDGQDGLRRYFPYNHVFSFKSYLRVIMTCRRLLKELPGHNYSISLTLSIDFKILGFEIAVVPAVLRCEAEHAIVRVGHSLRIIQLIAVPPDELFGLAVMQYLHGAPEHDAPVEAFIEEIYAGWGKMEKMDTKVS